MAWSDAARRAAAEARRRKAGMSIMVGTSIRSRDEMARYLRKARKMTGHAGLNSIAQRNSVARNTAADLSREDQRGVDLRKRAERQRLTYGGYRIPRGAPGRRRR